MFPSQSSSTKNNVAIALNRLDQSSQVGNSTGVSTHSKLDETILAPSSGPRVSDNPIWFLSISVVSDKLDYDEGVGRKRREVKEFRVRF